MGLDKLSSTKEVVATLQEELTVLQPQLVKTMKEVTPPVSPTTTTGKPDPTSNEHLESGCVLNVLKSAYPVHLMRLKNSFRSALPPSLLSFPCYISPSLSAPIPSPSLMNCSSSAIDEIINRFTIGHTQVEDMMVEINADKEEAEVVRVKVEAEEATANEKVGNSQYTRGGKGVYS